MYNTITTNETIEDLGILTSPLSDSMNTGLAYLLRTMEGKQLLPLFFCRDYMQDFVKIQFTKKNEHPPYLYLPKDYAINYPNFLEDNPKLNIMLVPHTKASSLLYNNKELLATECLLNTDLIKLYIKQLNIFENQLIKIGFINFPTEVSLKTIKYKHEDQEFTKNILSLDFDTAYLYKPELISLYMLLIRCFLTITIFVSDFEDIYTFFRNVSKFNLKYIAESDLRVFNSPEFQLHLPMYLEGKLATTNWDLFNSNGLFNIEAVAHTGSGIYKYLTKTKLLTKN